MPIVFSVTETHLIFYVLREMDTLLDFFCHFVQLSDEISLKFPTEMAGHGGTAAELRTCIARS